MNKQWWAIQNECKKRILKYDADVPTRSGIYVFSRTVKHVYVGQAKNLLERLAGHLMGHDSHIDKSLKKHGLWSEENPNGWHIAFKRYDGELDRHERETIEQYMNSGAELYNITSGGQGVGKVDINQRKEPKGYRKGLEKGYDNARKDLQKWFKHLDVKIKSDKPNKIQEKALAKLKEFLSGDDIC